jgi:hypothetical protein
MKKKYVSKSKRKKKVDPKRIPLPGAEMGFAIAGMVLRFIFRDVTMTPYTFEKPVDVPGEDPITEDAEFTVVDPKQLPTPNE